MSYHPRPIDTSKVVLPTEILELTERLAENAHDIWATQRLAEGWRVGPERSDQQKTNPCLVSYDQLPDSERQYDRNAAIATLKAILALGYQITPRSPVIWLRRAESRVCQDHIGTWNRELGAVFAAQSPIQLTVSDVFGGFSNDQQGRLVLGVQLQTCDSAGSHIVKLGTVQQVGKDFEGWRRCVLHGGVSSRILLNVKSYPLSDNRCAVVYEDAYRLFGNDPETESPKWLELAADWSIRDSKPDVRSVERVVVQVFGELNRCLYQGARPHSTRPGDFYRNEWTKVGKAAGQSACDRWATSPDYLRLRRDAIWLITSRDKPNAPPSSRYLDPVDYVNWALAASGNVPQTLVGRAHGDLHGRNILVGVVRGEVEQPVIIDYGDMAEDNLPVWDFVKLECELKTRILPNLFSHPGAREALAEVAPRVRPARRPEDIRDGSHSTEHQVSTEGADRLEFAFQFEQVLYELTTSMVSQNDAETPLSAERRQKTGHAALDKALGLIHRIRQEAALRLGYTLDRSGQWHDEYFFALCVYGVLKAKWNIERPQLEWSLISAGVAAAKLSQAAQVQTLSKEPIPEPPRLPPTVMSHFVPLAWAHRLWEATRYEAACALLQQARIRFPAAMTLNTEYALCLAASGNLDQATQQVMELRPLCPIFGDEETLCRLGRIYKELGDKEWGEDDQHPDHSSFVGQGHSGWQLYGLALDLYRQAFKIRHDYFPGINAATLAALRGDMDVAKSLAESVLQSCQDSKIDNPDEVYWVYATQGEACLLLDRRDQATQFYRCALTMLRSTNKPGVIQSMYNQIRRLAWCLGPDRVRPVIELLEKAGGLNDIERGPFQDTSRA